MKIHPYDQLTRFLVDSDTEPGQQYLVDLVPYWGVGRCDCHHFRIRMEPNLVARPTRPDDYRCKHIQFARHHLAYQFLDLFIASEFNKEKPGRFGPAHAGSNQPKALRFRP